jgi:hypothetical protein
VTPHPSPRRRRLGVRSSDDADAGGLSDAELEAWFAALREDLARIVARESLLPAVAAAIRRAGPPGRRRGTWAAAAAIALSLFAPPAAGPVRVDGVRAAAPVVPPSLPFGAPSEGRGDRDGPPQPSVPGSGPPGSGPPESGPPESGPSEER